MRSILGRNLVRSSVVGALALAALPALAQPYGPRGHPADRPYATDVESYSAQARVVRSVPIREAIGSAPRQECWVESTGGGDGNRTAGAVIGGIAGGLIGHQFGSGSGNTAATIAGSIGGAAAGSEIARRSGRGEREVERCREVGGGYEERIVGYDVTYRLHGREFSTRLPYDPGPELPVNVTIEPAR